jgi:acetylornithine deacetylase
MEIFELTKALINIESVTGHERACADFLRSYLVARSFQVELQPVSRDRFNVFAKKGKPDVVLSTHIDTVPPFLLAREDEEFIFGRGACDAKGILASQIAAAERLLREGVTDFGLLYLVGEETTSDGAREANLHPPGSLYMINGEPTENKLVVGSKGILRLDIQCKGRMAHSAYPHLGESAIDKLLDVLVDLRKVSLSCDPLLGPSTLNIGVISGGRAANVVPDQASAQILIRTVCDSEDLRRKISELLTGRCEFEFVRDTPTMRMEKLDGYETDVVSFTTDLPALTRWGRPVLLGPGSIRVAHTEHECVAKAELVKAVDLYCQLVRELKNRVESRESKVES